jgi:hypothetical protein
MMVKIFGWQNKMASYGKALHTNKITVFFFIWQQFNVMCNITLDYVTNAKIMGTRSCRQLNIVWRHLVFVGPL